MHEFGGFDDHYSELIKTKSTTCASPHIRAKIYKSLEKNDIKFRTITLHKNTDKIHGLGRPLVNRIFSYNQIATLILGGRLTFEGLKSAIEAFENDAPNYKKYRGEKGLLRAYDVLSCYEYEKSYSSSLDNFAPMFEKGLSKKQIVQILEKANPYPTSPFYPMWYARLVKFTKRIELVDV